MYNCIIPVIVLIIGLHYFPLGMLYHTPVHFIVGAAVVSVSVSVSAMIFLPADSYNSAASGVSALAGVCSTAVLGVYMVELVKQ